MTTMEKNNISLHHVSLVVSNTEKALQFYSEVLGLKSVARPDLGFPGAWFQLGPQQIHILELPNPDPATGRPEHGGRDRHVAFNVDDLDLVKAELDQKNIIYTLSKSGRRALFFRDLDGNALEIIERS